MKEQLTENERIIAAYMFHVLGTSQQEISVAFCVNSGRVSEACTAIELAATNPVEMRKRMKGEANAD